MTEKEIAEKKQKERKSHGFMIHDDLWDIFMVICAKKKMGRGERIVELIKRDIRRNGEELKTVKENK